MSISERQFNLRIILYDILEICLIFYILKIIKINFGDNLDNLKKINLLL